MNDREKQALYISLVAIERLVVDLERRMRAADDLLKRKYPDIHAEYLKTLGSAQEQQSIAAQSLEELRQELFPDNA